MIDLKDVVAIQEGRQILGPLNLELAPDGITAVVGRNGSGKSTFLRMLHGLLLPSDGALTLTGFPASKQSFVFQNPVFLDQSLHENLALPLRLRGAKSIRSAVEEISQTFNLNGLLSQNPKGFSGGERQRAAIARALIIQPTLLFLDEPTASLDRATTSFVEQALIQEKAKDTRIILSSHSMAQVRRIADDVIFVDDGLAFGPFPSPKFLDTPPDVARDWLQDGL